MSHVFVSPLWWIAQYEKCAYDYAYAYRRQCEAASKLGARNSTPNMRRIRCIVFAASDEPKRARRIRWMTKRNRKCSIEEPTLLAIGRRDVQHFIGTRPLSKVEVEIGIEIQLNWLL